MRKDILLILFSVFLLGILWVSLIPIWHTPDEQAHFGQVAFIAEKGRTPGLTDKLDLTEEIYISENLLGTKRDKFGNNNFTFHPDYRIQYSNTLIGLSEASIAALANTRSRKIFVKEESTHYPVSYYYPATVIYNLFYSSDIFTRVFFIRLMSLLIFLLNVFFVYKLGKLIYPKWHSFAFTLAAIVGFQPMMMFSNMGVTSDVLGNFLFTVFIYICSKILILGMKISDVLILLVIAVIAIYTKPQFILVIPLLILLFTIILLRNMSKERLFLIPLLSILLTIALFFITNSLLKDQFSIISRFLNNFNLWSLIKYTKEYTISHTIREVLPWYWGVYDWLGVTYPRIVHRIINRLLVVFLIGLIILFIRNLVSFNFKKLLDKKVEAIIFLIIISILYYISISFYDWLSWYDGGFSLGIQGRYFFPVISIHAFLILRGIMEILPEKLKFLKLREISVKLIFALMWIFNIYALIFAISIYYDLSSISIFIIQASQYKPWFIKGNFLVILILFSLITTSFSIGSLFFLGGRYENNYKKHT